MDEAEIYWYVTSCISRGLISGITGYYFYYFVKSFLQSRKYVWCVGITYFIVMQFLEYMPYVISNFAAYGIGVLMAFFVMCLLDRRNVAQKIYLAITFFLLRWISAGIAVYFYDVLIDAVQSIPAVAGAELVLQFIIFVGYSVFLVGANFVFIWLAVYIILKVYVNRRENMTWSELLLFLFPSLSIMVGYFGFQFCESVYEKAVGCQIVDCYPEYGWLALIYRLISFAAILVMIVVFQNIKKRQEEERQNELLAGELENTKRHIEEVERLYCDIRSLRHDMGNHIMTLENLYGKGAYREAEEYVSELRERFCEVTMEIATGNPVTDVILMEKQREAKEKGIAFTCEFYYPEGVGINAFDISVILNNALTNAVEGSRECDAPRIQIHSYRKKNAYMIEVRNRCRRTLIVDEETGLPESTKADQRGHGFGLANIQRVAQKYFGDIDIEQAEDEFILSIMLITE